MNTFACLTVNFACNFAHERDENAKKSEGLLYIVTVIPMVDAFLSHESVYANCCL